MGRKFSRWQLRTIIFNTSSCPSTDRYSLKSVRAAFPENYPNSPSARWMRSNTLGARISANLSREPSEMVVPSCERMWYAAVADCEGLWSNRTNLWIKLITSVLCRCTSRLEESSLCK